MSSFLQQQIGVSDEFIDQFAEKVLLRLKPLLADTRQDDGLIMDIKIIFVFLCKF